MEAGYTTQSKSLVRTSKVNTKKKIVLFHPRTMHENNYRYYHVPYSVLSTASLLDRSKYEIIVLDDNVNQKNDYLQDLSTWESEILCVGISSMVGAQIDGAIRFAKAVRDLDRRVPLIWGGPLPTMLPEETILHPNVDIAVQGQGEITLKEIVERLDDDRSIENIKGTILLTKNNQIIKNQKRPFEDLNTFPAYSTSYSLVNLENYIWPDEHIASRTISYHSSQGCPYNCGFCCEVSLWERWWSGLTATRVLQDIQYLVTRFNVNGIKFYDSEFFINRKRALEFAQGLIERKIDVHWAASIHPQNLHQITCEQLQILRQSGLTRLLIGAESGVQQELDLIGKNVKKEILYEIAKRCAEQDIVICFTFVTGYPSMPSTHIDETIRFADDLHRFEPMHEAKLHFFGPYPGAPLYDLALEYGFVPPTSLEAWAKYDYYNILTPWVEPQYAPLLREFNETHYPYINPYPGHAEGDTND